MEVDSIQYIVSKLNESPFDMKLRLIDFHEKEHYELLQIMIDVFVSIDTNSSYSSSSLSTNNKSKINPNQAYYFNNNQKETLHDGNSNLGELLSFISSVIRYNGIPKKGISGDRNDNSGEDDDNDEGSDEKFRLWMEGFCLGEKEIIYPIIEYCLRNYDSVKKRAYLAPYMTPIQLPLDIVMSQRGDNLSKLSQRYQSLQDEFRDIHMTYDELLKDDNDMAKVSLKEEVESLQEEKEQLLLQVKDLENNKEYVGGHGGVDCDNDKNALLFERMLCAITSLRREEEEHILLNDRMDEQRNALIVGKTKLNELQDQYTSLKSLVDQEEGHGLSTSKTIMDEIQKQLNEVTTKVHSDLSSQKGKLKKEINLLEREKSGDGLGEILCDEDELEVLIERVRDLEEEYHMKERILEKEQSKEKYSKIAMFKQHVNVAKKKELTKERDVQEIMERFKKLQGRLTFLASNGREKVMKKSSVDVNHTPFQQKVDERDRINNEISVMQNESLELQRTIDIWQTRLHNIQQSITEKEEQGNAKGFHKVQEEILQVEQHEAEIDERKGQTLQEISDMITAMTEKLKIERDRLQPLIQDLKQTRAEFQDVEEVHGNAKKRYDKLSQRLALDRQQLEKECDELQEEWQDEERNYHYLINVNEVAKANVDNLRKEEDWRNGVEKMLPEFMCLEDLYLNKLAQQENMAKQLRLDQRKLKESEQDNLKQREMFQALERVLRIKHQLKTKHGMESNDNSINDEMKEIEAMSL